MKIILLKCVSCSSKYSIKAPLKPCDYPKKASNGDPKYFITMLSGLFVERSDADKEGI